MQNGSSEATSETKTTKIRQKGFSLPHENFIEDLLYGTENSPRKHDEKLEKREP
jgi:hypothetical protein